MSAMPADLQIWDYLVIVAFFAVMVVVTVLGLVVGTALCPDTPEERAQVEAFFRKAETPS